MDKEVSRLEERIKGIYKRNEGRWEARFKVGINTNGRAIYRSVYAKTKEEVIAKRKAIIGELLCDDTNGEPLEFNLLILGAGTHGRDVYEIVQSLHVFKKISFLDDDVKGENIIGKCRDVVSFRNQYPCAFVAVGDNRIRRKYGKLLREYNFLIPNIVSPAANISPMEKLGDGVAILPLARVGDAEIGDFSIIASNGVVNSGAKLKKYCHVDCGAIVMKDARVKEGIWIKSGDIYE